MRSKYDKDDEKRCGICKWHRKVDTDGTGRDEWACACKLSKSYARKTEYTDVCKFFEKKEE